MKFGSITNIFRNAVHMGVTGLAAIALVACGGGGGSPGTVAGGSGSTSTTATSVSLLFSTPELPSAGATGTEVTITALVKNANNNTIPSVPVTFSASSGALSDVSAATDTSGKATAKLSTSGDRANRTITITAKAGNVSTTGTVTVSGTAVTATGPTTITSGGTGDFVISVKDSAGVAVPNVPVTISSAKGNPISILSSGGGSSSSPLTNSVGQVSVRISGAQSGTDTLSFASQGATKSVSYTVNSVSLRVATVGTTVNSSGNAQTSTGSCTKIAARYENAGVPQTGTVNITASRGGLYTDNVCTQALTASGVQVVAGDAAAYIKSDTAGVATIIATVVNGPTAQTNLEFAAPLTSTATIAMQAEPAVIGTNATSQNERSRLTVVIRDGTVNNNLVKDAVIEFTITSDPSGGSLSTPVATTGSDGSATVDFIAGAATTQTNGVQIQAKIQGTSKTASTTLTVSRKSLFITAGTGNTLDVPNTTQYKQDYSVFVTDATGNPVSGVNVTASVRVVHYYKGSYKTYTQEEVDALKAAAVAAGLPADSVTVKAGWNAQRIYQCENEDSGTMNGILDAGEDFNLNGVLDPGTPLNVSSSGQTDATGTAIISIRYPKDRANWTSIILTVRGSVAGTEATYSTQEYILPILAGDLQNASTSPPGDPNPYGVNACNVAN
ncbi:Ig-like domain-containing protein [Noviherbaspirillum sp.]|uniref:Ig-like domain-containing protein n=1 Tax=Noviherbaspirillum sp. TaxID=1926288 RepID=UPI002B45FBB8|nr:Ig-like domain-containing protein [Noviherbaspirillum sp.]HJV82525.1 Ig-like domain-containing protein [Noviherbaspirillum sp.]